MEKLGQRYASPSIDRRSYASGAEESGDERATPTGSLGRRGSIQEKWKMGAKKALLQWVQAQVSCFIFFIVLHDLFINVYNFARSANSSGLLSTILVHLGGMETPSWPLSTVSDQVHELSNIILVAYYICKLNPIHSGEIIRINQIKHLW